MSLSPLGSGEIVSQSGEGLGGSVGSTLNNQDKPSPKEIFGDDIAGLIAMHLKNTCQTFRAYRACSALADKLTEATIEKLTPLTTLLEILRALVKLASRTDRCYSKCHEPPSRRIE